MKDKNIPAGILQGTVSLIPAGIPLPVPGLLSSACPCILLASGRLTAATRFQFLPE